MQNLLRSIFAFALAFQVLVAIACAQAPKPGAWADPYYVPNFRGDRAAQIFQAMRVDGEAATPTQVQSITQNEEAWWTRWKMISNAQRSIDLTYFIVKDDVFGMSLLGLLAQKARQGVRIRFMLDSRGSKSLSSVFWGRGYLKFLSGFPQVDVRIFNPLSKALLRLPKDLRHAVASNHDKILAVDGEWVLTGGRNIAAEYFTPHEDDPHAYRDTDILLRGHAITNRAVRAFEEEFAVLKNKEIELNFPGWTPKAFQLELARQVMDRFLHDGTFYDLEEIGLKLRNLAQKLRNQLGRMPNLRGIRDYALLANNQSYPALLLDKSSFAHKFRNDITLNLLRLIETAEESILIQNPYVILTKEMKQALTRAAARGIKIVIHTNSPTSTDSLIPQAYFLRDWKDLLRKLPHAEIYAMKERTVHSKVLIVDNRITVIGTYNLDPLSQSVNSELVAVVESAEFANQQRLSLAKDAAGSYRYYVRRAADGSLEEFGPHQQYKGFKKLLADLLGRWKWFKKIV